jgi:hypothetical protein
MEIEESDIDETDRSEIRERQRKDERYGKSIYDL